MAPSKNPGFAASARICVERRDDLRALFRRQDADAFERPRERLRAANIGIDQPPVEIQRPGESLEDFRRPRFKPPAPQLHDLAPEDFAAASPARTLIGSPIRLMKPSASFWS